MSRDPRLQVIDGIYHVRARGDNGEDIFRDDADRVAYLDLIAEAHGKLTFQLYAFVLMSNHIHAVLRTPDANLAEIVHRIHRAYAFRFNRRYNRTGHVFGGRYRSRPVLDDTDLLGVTTYVHLNPVRAGLTLEAGAYQWSSYRDYVEPRGSTLVDSSPVLAIVGRDVSKSRAAYADLVANQARHHPGSGQPSMPNQLLPHLSTS